MDAGGLTDDLRPLSPLDASQRDLQFRSESPSALKPQRRDPISATIIAANDSLISWADGNRLLVRGQCVEDFGQPVLALALRRDSNVVAAVTATKLFVKDLDREGPPTLSFHKPDPGFALVAWHPSHIGTLGTAYRSDFTLWVLGEQSDPGRAKVFSQAGEILAIAFSPEATNIVSIAVETGVVRTIDMHTDTVLFETRANCVALNHLSNKSLLSVAKTKAEMTLWNCAKRDKEHNLAVAGASVDFVVMWQSLVFMVDAHAKKLWVVLISDQTKFSGIGEFTLDVECVKGIDVRMTSKGDIELLCLSARSVDSFLLRDCSLLVDKRRPSRLEKTKKAQQADPYSALHKKLDELQGKLDSGLVLPGLHAHLDKAVSQHLDQLSGIIKDEQQKIQVSMKVLLAQAFKEQFQSAIVPLFEGAIKEMFTQVTVGFQEGVKEFTERNAVEEAKFQSVMHHMKGSVDATTELTAKLGKLAFKQLQRVNELESKFVTEQLSPSPPRPNPHPAAEVPALKLELDRLLRNEEFESAISLVLVEADERLLYRVLSLINPVCLYAQKPLSNAVSLRVCHRILTHFPNGGELPEYLLWLQTICKNVVLKGEDPNLLQYILEMMLSRSKTSPEITPAKELFFSKIMQDMQDRHR